MAYATGLPSPGLSSTPLLLGQFVAITYTFQAGLPAPSMGGAAQAPTTIWVWDGTTWKAASQLTVITGA